MPIASVVIDDGTDSIRVSVFRDGVEKLFKRSYEDILRIRDDPLLFEDIRKETVGKQISVSGKAIKNAMFDNMEMNASLIREVNATDIINELMPKSI